MSNVAVKGNASGTGTFTIAAPNSNNDRQFDLPDEAGTVLTSATDLEPQVKTATNATGSAPIYACRAWVNFKGTGTVSIRDSGNVSSITDNGAGDYTVNFAIAMPDTNYTTVASSQGNGFYARGFPGVDTPKLGSTPTASSIRIAVGNNSSVSNDGSLEDRGFVNLAVFR